METRPIPPGGLARGPIRQTKLSVGLARRIEKLRAEIHDVFPSTLAEWLDDFSRDSDPEREVLRWERLSRCYSQFRSTRECEPCSTQGGVEHHFQREYGPCRIPPMLQRCRKEALMSS